MKKVLYIGKIKDDNKLVDLFCKSELKAGKLSISGVIGPKSNGDAVGGCGQIDMEFEHQDPKQNDRRTTNPYKADDILFAEGWDKLAWYKFLNVWNKYHLNDMKASCEHQEAQGWEDMASEPVNIYKWKLTSETSSRQTKITDNAVENLKTKGYFSINTIEKFILNLEYWMKTQKDELPDSLAEYYREDTDGHIETKNRGWLDESESPLGLLSKPCPVCGYKYGTAWKKRELPAEVITFIESLPEPTKQPAWI